MLHSFPNKMILFSSKLLLSIICACHLFLPLVCFIEFLLLQKYCGLPIIHIGLFLAFCWFPVLQFSIFFIEVCRVKMFALWSPSDLFSSEKQIYMFSDLVKCPRGNLEGLGLSVLKSLSKSFWCNLEGTFKDKVATGFNALEDYENNNQTFDQIIGM